MQRKGRGKLLTLKFSVHMWYASMKADFRYL
jgi:hypothetical protein